MTGILPKAAAGKLEGASTEAARTLMGVMLFTIAATIMLSFVEKLGIWLLLDFPIAIFYAVLHKGKKTVAVECGERSDCVQRNVQEIPELLCELRRFLKLVILFSEERLSPASLLEARFAKEDILKRVETARIKKPAFTVIRDRESESLLVFIRGTRSLSDMVTDANAIADPVSFNHVNVVVSGQAHRGMLAAARWIQEQCTPILSEALRQHPTFKIKIVGHSLGGGTAALLTCMLREKKEFSSCTCVTFGPAACITLELVEFGKPFITSIINGSDMVPTLSVSSIHDFIFQGRIKRTKFQNATCSAIRSRLPFVSCCSNAIADHAVARATQEHELEEVQDDDIPNSEEEINDDDAEEDTTILDKLDTHLYPPGRIMHIVPENSNSNRNEIGSDAERVYLLYETPTQLYEKLRLSRGLIVDHLTSEYLKGIQQLINQLEKWKL